MIRGRLSQVDRVESGVGCDLELAGGFLGRFGCR
jgi:hypothetical protein